MRRSLSYEDQLLSRLKDTLPKGVKVTVVADRGFAEKKFFQFLAEELKFNYIIRIKYRNVPHLANLTDVLFHSIFHRQLNFEY